ncbi:MAG: hypothetical protein ACD_54C01173G0001 [uncultured bacterium]|nr:MAG: hypothetical protein ACD_54C01173G0001 [uncultured bacterium]
MASSAFSVPTKFATNRVFGWLYTSNGAPTCSARPPFITTTRSDIDSASS